MEKLFLISLLFSTATYAKTESCDTHKQDPLFSVSKTAKDLKAKLNQGEMFFFVNFQGNENEELKTLQESKDKNKIKQIVFKYESLVQKKLIDFGCKSLTLQNNLTEFPSDSILIHFNSSNCRAPDNQSGVESCKKGETMIQLMEDFVGKSYWIEQSFCLKK